MKTPILVTIPVFNALTAVGTFIRIPLPFSPVPATFQTLFTYLARTVLGGPAAALSQLLYITLGLIGLPVFASGTAGVHAVLEPTGGVSSGSSLGLISPEPWSKRSRVIIPSCC